MISLLFPIAVVRPEIFHFGTRFCVVWQLQFDRRAALGIAGFVADG
jgi:hypothetical protein